MKYHLVAAALAASAVSAKAQGNAAVLHDDSVAIVRAALHAALAGRVGASPVCVVAVAESLGTGAGQAFVAEGRAVAKSMGAASDSASALRVTLLGVTGRDTVRVRVRLEGDDGPRRDTFWMNEVTYALVRATPPGSWTLLPHPSTYFADYIATQPRRVPPRACLNARR